MTIKREYICNLCRDRHEPEELIGLAWLTNQWMRANDCRQVENHICTGCLNALAEIRKAIAEK